MITEEIIKKSYESMLLLIAYVKKIRSLYIEGKPTLTALSTTYSLISLITDELKTRDYHDEINAILNNEWHEDGSCQEGDTFNYDYRILHSEFNSQLFWYKNLLKEYYGGELVIKDGEFHLCKKHIGELENHNVDTLEVFGIVECSFSECTETAPSLSYFIKK